MALPWSPGPTNNNTPVCPPAGSLARRDRAGAGPLWHALAQKDQGGLDLPANRQSQSRSTPSWSQQNRKHCPLFRRRGRRRSRHSRTGRHLIPGGRADTLCPPPKGRVGPGVPGLQDPGRSRKGRFSMTQFYLGLRIAASWSQASSPNCSMSLEKSQVGAYMGKRTILRIIDTSGYFG